MHQAPNFAIYYAGDAYSTKNKIMGRQSAGKAFMKGVARTWPTETIHGTGPSELDAQTMMDQLNADGFMGQVIWSSLPSLTTVKEAGALYYPSPCPKDLAHLRNTQHPAAFSLMGVTFTLSSAGAMDQVAELILPPFKPWDALICISQCAKDFTLKLHQEMKDWWLAQAGAMRFNTPQLPVILLGVDAPFFQAQPADKASARQALGVSAKETVFLFSGRLSFHAKANPAPMYQALEKAAQQTPVVCVEAGVFPNEEIKKCYIAAQNLLAPSVRFIWVDGQDNVRYQQAWQGADVFISLSDNIQETFGLTPVEAMAAGLPVIVSDWNGYKETVREGIDGYRIPTVLPPNGTASDLALRHALDLDTYDFYIGRSSLATVVEPNALAQAVLKLATDPALRQTMGAAGQLRANQTFDWPVILNQYAELAAHLAQIREQGFAESAHPWPQRADPFKRFNHFPTATLQGTWSVKTKPDASVKLQELFALRMTNYALNQHLLPNETIAALTAVLEKNTVHTVNSVLTAAGCSTPVGVRSLMWLWKFDLIQISP